MEVINMFMQEFLNSLKNNSFLVVFVFLGKFQVVIQKLS